MVDGDEVIFQFGEDNALEVGWRPSTNELLVNGVPVVTKTEIGLSFWQTIGAIVTAGGIGLAGLAALLQIVDWCKQHL